MLEVRDKKPFTSAEIDLGASGSCLSHGIPFPSQKDQKHYLLPLAVRGSCFSMLSSNHSSLTTGMPASIREKKKAVLEADDPKYFCVNHVFECAMIYQQNL